MSVNLLTEHNLEFLSFKGGYTGSSKSTLVKIHIVGNHMSRLIYAIVKEGIMGNIHMKLFEIWTSGTG